MNSILQRIQQAQKANPVLNKAASGGVITEQSEKSAELATDMVQGAENIPDVTKDGNPAPIADLGNTADKASNETTSAVPENPNEENPDVQEILQAKEVVVKTANALLPIAQAFNNLSIAELDAMFNKQASAEDFTNEQVIDMIDKLANAGNPVATAFAEFCNGYASTMQKIANDAEALMAQGVPAEEAEALATQAALEGSMPTEDVPADVATDAGAELEAAVAEITAEAAKEIMEVAPEASPEEAQAMAEELVMNKLQEEMAMVEGGMEQTASAEETPAEEPAEDTPATEEATAESVPAEASEDIEGDIAEAIDELKREAAKEIMEVVPEASPEEALEIASELVDNKLAEELSVAGGMEQTASAEEVPAEAAGEVEEVINELIIATAEDIKASAPEMPDEEAIELASDAVMDAVATASEQEAIGATTEDGEYAVPDEVAAASIEDMIKTASANPLREALTPVVATIFNIDQTAFINRINK